MSVRSTFTVRLAGTGADHVLTRLGDALDAAGFLFEEDWEEGDAEDGLPVLEIRTLSALRAALDLLPSLDIYTVETNPEAV
jgi:hypothetical protein